MRSRSVSVQICARQLLNPFGLPSVKGRIGEQGRRDRLQRQANPEFLHHVGFGGIVQIHLDRAGAQHHVEPEAALFRHVVAHDPVAALGHPRHVGALPFRIEAQADQAGAHLFGHRFGLGQVGVDLVAGLVDVFQRRAGEFELAAGFEADRSVAPFQADQGVLLAQRRPAEALQAFEQGPDAALALIGQAAVILPVEGKFFVLGADAPVRRRFVALFDAFDELCAGMHRLGVGGGGDGHAQVIRNWPITNERKQVTGRLRTA